MEEFYTTRGNNRDIERYLSNRRIQSIVFDADTKSYRCDQGKRGGLTSSLKGLYYPYYQRVRKKGKFRATKRRRKASSMKRGKQIDQEIQHYVACGKVPQDPMALAVVHYLERDKPCHVIEACQLPLFVQVGDQERITQADVITSDEKGRLWMWEIKSGWNQAKAQGYLQQLRPLKVPSMDHNHWELQRHYTHKGLVESGLPVYKSHVLNVFEEDDRIVIQKRAVPKWCQSIVL